MENIFKNVDFVNILKKSEPIIIIASIALGVAAFLGTSENYKIASNYAMLSSFMFISSFVYYIIYEILKKIDENKLVIIPSFFGKNYFRTGSFVFFIIGVIFLFLIAYEFDNINSNNYDPNKNKSMYIKIIPSIALFHILYLTGFFMYIGCKDIKNREFISSYNAFALSTWFIIAIIYAIFGIISRPISYPYFVWQILFVILLSSLFLIKLREANKISDPIRKKRHRFIVISIGIILSIVVIYTEYKEIINIYSEFKNIITTLINYIIPSNSTSSINSTAINSTSSINSTAINSTSLSNSTSRIGILI